MDTSSAKTELAEIEKEIDAVLAEPAPAAPAAEEAEEDTKLTPQQRLEKQLRTSTEKLDKIRARQGTAKQTPKQKEADPAEMEKLTKKIEEINGKLAKLAAPKPAKKGKKAAEPAPEPAPVAAPEPVAEPPKKKAKKAAAPAPEPVAAPEPAAPAKEHLAKWTPTWTKQFKAAADAAKQEVTDALKAEFKEKLNALTAEEFKDWSPAQHCEAFFKSRNAEHEEKLFAATTTFAVEDADEEVWEVKLEGQLYTVGEKTRNVYRVTDKGDEPVVGDLDLVNKVLEKLGGINHAD